MRHNYTLFRRKGSKIWYFYYYVGAERKSTSTGKTLKFEAEEYSKEFIKRLREGDQKIITLGDICKPYFTNDCPRQKTLKQKNKPMGEEHRKAQLSRLKRYILTHPICTKTKDTLTRGDFIDFIDYMIKKYTISTANNAAKVLKTICKEEFNRGNLKVDFMAGLGNISKEKKEKGVFTRKETDIMFRVKPSLFSTARERIVFLLTCETGMRRNEVLAIKWKNIDWENHIINIVDAWENFYQRSNKRPKWNKIRQTPMSEEIEKGLRLYYESVLTCRPEDYIICWDDSSPVSPRTWQRWFENICNEMKIDRKVRNLTAHSFRHTCITRWKQAGIPQELIQLWAGHSEAKTTAIYTHYSNEFMVEQLRNKANTI
jgi:integrase